MSAIGLTNVLNWCFWCILLIESILSLKITNVISGENHEVNKKNGFWAS